MDPIAFIAPAWVWILSVLGLLAFGVLMGALLCKVLQAMAALSECEDREAAREGELAELRGRVEDLERPEPYPVRYDPPVTALDSKPQTVVLPAEGDTLPPPGWVTHVGST
jgi:hypothetical protein